MKIVMPDMGDPAEEAASTDYNLLTSIVLQVA
jgi:hypothetical protein